MANSNKNFPNQLQRDKDRMARDVYHAVQKGSQPVATLAQQQGNTMVRQGKAFASKYNLRNKSMFGNTISTPKRTLKLGKDHYRISVNVSAGWLSMMNKSTYQMRKPHKGALTETVRKGTQQKFNMLVQRNDNNVNNAVRALDNKRY